MPHATASDGVKLYYEEAGSGNAVIFVHEFAGDHRSWEPQMRYFSRRYRCITYNARGYPPSDVPDDVAKYSQARARDDIDRGARSPEDRQGARRRPVDGRLRRRCTSASTHPHRARSLVIGRLRLRRRSRAKSASFRAECEAAAAAFDAEGMRGGAEVRPRADARAVPEQGPARLAGVRRPARRALRQGVGAHACAACRCGARRSTSWSTACRRSTCRRW